VANVLANIINQNRISHELKKVRCATVYWRKMHQT
jgi:hypothetical protein